tara:strand:- start:947 stop:1093 length:147 start_codon:yes stop_codon:yes gene_type:complete
MPEKDDCLICEEKLNKCEDGALFYCEKCRDKKEKETQLYNFTGLNIKL